MSQQLRLQENRRVWTGLVLVGVTALLPPAAMAQPVPDVTLGAEASQVVENFQGAPIEVITGGARRGPNLFHSFSQLNVLQGRSAYFLTDPAVRTVMGRVTGTQPSEILGRLGTFQLLNGQLAPSSANLFLLNPNGILFGPNSSLDVGGSFVATTANAVQFANGELFHASVPNSPSALLTVDPGALLYTAIAAQSPAIINRSQLVDPTNLVGTTTGLQVQNGRSLLLVGGDVRLEGGAAFATGNGRVELGGLAGIGAIGLEASGDALRLSMPEAVARGNVALQASIVSSYGGGSTAVYAQNLALTGNSEISAVLLPGEGGDRLPTGDVQISVSDRLVVDNSAIAAAALSGALGGTGNLTIQTGSLQIGNQGGLYLLGEREQGRIVINARGAIAADQAFILTGNAPGIGKNGDLVMTAQSINLSNQSRILTTSFRQGATGNILLQAQDAITLSGGTSISGGSSAALFGRTNTESAGTIQIRAKNLQVSDFGTSILATNFDQAQSGSIQILAQESIVLDNAATISGATSGLGRGSDILLQSRSLALLRGGVVLTASTRQGQGGDVQIQASDAIVIQGFVPNPDSAAINSGLRTSGVLAGTQGPGDAGNVVIDTRQLTLADGGYITTSTSSNDSNPLGPDSGLGGQITIRATESVEVRGIGGNQQSNIDTATTGSGAAGRLTIATGKFTVRDGAAVRTGNFEESSGAGGALVLTATESVELFGVGNAPVGTILSSLSSRAVGQGNAGDLTITTPRLSLRDGAQIEAGNRPGSQGAGGRLTINAPDQIEVSGLSPDGVAPSLISSSTANQTDAQPVQIQTGRLSLRGGGSIAANSTGSGRGGDLVVIATQAVDITGIANQYPSQLVVSASGAGQAGNLVLTTPRLKLDQSGRLDAQSASVTGGNIVLTVPQLLLLRNGGQISATAGANNPQAPGNGGTITINAGFIVAIPKENSDITANATQGRGGSITINALGIFGLQPQLQLTPLSDITASSAGGLNGTISLTTPDNRAIQNNLTPLPNNSIDTNALLAQTCLIRKDGPQGTFYIVGTGGIPNRPGDLAISTYPTQPAPPIQSPAQPTAQRPWRLGDPIIEPQGFFQLADGRWVMSRECDRPALRQFPYD